VRSIWVQLAAKYKIPIRCVLFLADAAVCEHNNAVRAMNEQVSIVPRSSAWAYTSCQGAGMLSKPTVMQMNPENREILPKMAFTGFASRYERPQLSEGFQDIVEVPFEVGIMALYVGYMLMLL
jgi:bifunctional polynucleotide phosphatase/kinase